MSSSFFSRRCRSTSASSSSRRACKRASLASMDASVSTGSAVSRGPDADVGMFPDAIVATPAFLSPAVGGFLLGVSATGALLLEPVRVPRQQRALAGMAELADHVGGAALVSDVQVHGPAALLSAVPCHRGGVLLPVGESKKTSPPRTQNTDLTKYTSTTPARTGPRPKRGSNACARG